MKLNDLIGKLETQTCLNDHDFKELKKRIKQIKINFSLFEEIDVVIEAISNTMTAYYLDTKGLSHYDLIQKNELENLLETGHLQLIKI